MIDPLRGWQSVPIVEPGANSAWSQLSKLSASNTFGLDVAKNTFELLCAS